VDDNPDNLTLLSGLLRERGYRVRAATSGSRALSVVRAHPPELILLDINMPEMDGYQVCAALKADAATAAIPVIFISALDAPLDKVKAFEAGGVDYVIKPFDAAEVAARVGTQLRMARLARETEARKAELERAYQELKLAHDEIARLSSSTAGMLEDTGGWAGALAAEVAGVVGARAIGVYRLEDERFRPLATDGVPEPDWDELWPEGGVPREMSTGAGEGSRLVLPVFGVTGELRGAVVVDGKQGLLKEAERQVLRTFVQHLATALDLTTIRRQLALSQARRDAGRRDLMARGEMPVTVCPWCALCFADDGRPGLRCPEDGAELDRSYMVPSTLLGRYRLTRLLGEGGMGIVFEARDERLVRGVALKIIRAESLGDTSMRFRLEREARAVARIRHEGVVALYDSGEMEDGSAFLVMELLAGQDLGSVLAEHGPGTARQVATLLRQAGAALAAAHGAGVVHRDVKPPNLFLATPAEGDLRVKIVDFGIARSLVTDNRVTMTGQVIGTPAYMSPEQTLGRDADERSDVYSLAAVAYEALSGVKPVPAEGAFGEVLMDVLTVRPKRLSAHVPGVPAALDELFERGLAKSPEERPRDIAAFAEECARLLDEVHGSLQRLGWPGLLAPRRRPRSARFGHVSVPGPTVD